MANGRRRILLLLSLALLPHTHAFLHIPAATTRIRCRDGGTRISVGESDISQQCVKEDCGSSRSSSSPVGVDRQSFLKTLGLVTTAAMVARPQATPPPANAIGALADWQPDKRFAQHLVLNVPDMDAALAFYTQGLEMKVLRSRIVNGQNSTFIGFGPETLTVPKDFYPGVSSFNEYGAHFALELNEVKAEKGDETPILDPGTAVAYLQMAVPSLRISKLADAGGTIKSAYGWVVCQAPNLGLTHQIIVGARRDPVMMLALNVPDLKAATAFYKDVLGMKEVEYPLSRAPGSIYEPKQPKGSVYLAYNPDGFGVLLLPTEKKVKSVRPGGIVDKLAVLDTDVLGQGVDGLKAQNAVIKYAGEAPGIGTRVAVTSDPNGLGIVLVEYEDLEKELRVAAEEGTRRKK